MPFSEVNNKITDWLPITKEEVKKRNWDQLDIILITGDAYIDHPSFGIAIIGRVLENKGYKVAVIPQPNWRDDLRDFKKLGQPKLFFGVTSGNMDSMVNHYTANKRLRSNDAYTPGDKHGQRPDYAAYVYSKILKELYSETPVIIGGIEASMRRLAHYDYWSDKLKPSILFESNADMIVYGMGEKAIIEIAKKLSENNKIENLHSIPQTCFITDNLTNINNEFKTLELSSYEKCLEDKLNHAKNFKLIEEESCLLNSNTALIQKTKDKYIVVNPSNKLMTEQELDSIYNLPFTRLPHPKYFKKEPIPAYDMIRHSVNIHRGCFGGCGFCTISAHQGKHIVSRSEKSILNEVEQVSKMHDFKGNLSDLGGPSANMYKMIPKNYQLCEKCKRPSCVFPSKCNNLNINHSSLISLYKKVREHKKVKKAFVGSGVRYDLFVDNDKEYLKELFLNHISGRLKVAPEHTSERTLNIMRKPSYKNFDKLFKMFNDLNKQHDKQQQLIPYFISSHPGSTKEDMVELAIITKNQNFKLEQVQDFTPTPMTLSTVIYYTGYHPYTLEKVYVTRNKEEKLIQRSFFFWYLKENKKIRDYIYSYKNKH